MKDRRRRMKNDNDAAFSAIMAIGAAVLCAVCMVRSCDQIPHKHMSAYSSP